MIYLVPTPIGNLKDITIRSLETLEKVDEIICEDTRRSSVLLNHFNIKKKLNILNDFNESRMIPQILDKLRLGLNLALISDAGTPLISDPGFKLIRTCIEEGIEIDSLPGPSSVITALTMSGLPPDKFTFIGFLPDKLSNRTKVYNSIKDVSAILKTTFIFFIAPFKIKKTLDEMEGEFGGEQILTFAQELSKIHQQVRGKTISDWRAYFNKANPRGEWIGMIYLQEKVKDL